MGRALRARPMLETHLPGKSADKGEAEVDFVAQRAGRIWPMEVKAGDNLQAKSLKVYREKFAPAISLRTSLADFRRENWLCNVPLYAIGVFLANPARP